MCKLLMMITPLGTFAAGIFFLSTLTTISKTLFGQFSENCFAGQKKNGLPGTFSFVPLCWQIELADERVVVYSKKVRPYTLKRFTFYKNADIIIMN